MRLRALDCLADAGAADPSTVDPNCLAAQTAHHLGQRAPPPSAAP